MTAKDIAAINGITPNAIRIFLRGKGVAPFNAGEDLSEDVINILREKYTVEAKAKAKKQSKISPQFRESEAKTDGENGRKFGENEGENLAKENAELRERIAEIQRENFALNSRIICERGEKEMAIFHEKAAKELAENFAMQAENESKRHAEQLTELTAQLSQKRAKKPISLVIVMLVGLFGQMCHTFHLSWIETPIADNYTRGAISVLVAIAVDCTALVMTINRGGMLYLISFALFHLAVNISLHCALSETGEITFPAMLLSAALAFSNFSYSDLFTTKEND